MNSRTRRNNNRSQTNGASSYNISRRYVRTVPAGNNILGECYDIIVRSSNNLFFVFVFIIVLFLIALRFGEAEFKTSISTEVTTLNTTVSGENTFKRVGKRIVCYLLQNSVIYTEELLVIATSLLSPAVKFTFMNTFFTLLNYIFHICISKYTIFTALIFSVGLFMFNSFSRKVFKTITIVVTIILLTLSFSIEIK